MPVQNNQDRTYRHRRTAGACMIGIALGGFFDGILLHQILQWHHLFSAVTDGGAPLDLRSQILADGIFHLLHYVLALIGAACLWSGRHSLQEAGATRSVAGWALAGFGSWHAFDAVVSHWVLQIHRIRMDVEHPLLWDLAWLLPFGILPLVFGIRLLGTRGNDGGSPPSRGGRVAALLTMAAMVAGPVAALPPKVEAGAGTTLAVFRPGLSLDDIIAAADAVDGRLLWTDARRGVWLISLGPGVRASRLYRHGALMVSGGSIPVGCLNWTPV